MKLGHSHHLALARTSLQRARIPLPECLLEFLDTESARLHRQIDVQRPWHYAELHNPWSRAASVYDSWGFLDLCQSRSLLGPVAELIGEDIILFDSQWLPERGQLSGFEVTLESDAHRFPVDPQSGLTVLITFADAPPGTLWVDYDRNDVKSLDLQRGQILLLDSRTPYRVSTTLKNAAPAVYAARYFSASSRYLRDPTTAQHLQLMERYPLFNYAKMPLWLVHGEDRAENDFVTGFDARAGFWTNASW